MINDNITITTITIIFIYIYIIIHICILYIFLTNSLVYSGIGIPIGSAWGSMMLQVAVRLNWWSQHIKRGFHSPTLMLKSRTLSKFSLTSIQVPAFSQHFPTIFQPFPAISQHFPSIFPPFSNHSQQFPSIFPAFSQHVQYHFPSFPQMFRQVWCLAQWLPHPSWRFRVLHLASPWRWSWNWSLTRSWWDRTAGGIFSGKSWEISEASESVFGMT